MKLEIREIFLYGDYWEYMKLQGIFHYDNRYYTYEIHLSPLDNVVLTLDIDMEDWDDLSSYEWFEIVRPKAQLELNKYLTTNRNNKLLKLLREAIIVVIERDWKDVTVAHSNKHINYYVDKLVDCFENSDFNETEYKIQDVYKFYLDEHLNN